MVAQGAGRERAAPTFSLVLPTYNAAAFLGETWRKVARFLDDGAGAWEVLFVCDGCSDDSLARLRALVPAADDRVRILSYAPNRGKGYAVRHGLLQARGQYRLFTDVDLAYSFDDVNRVAERLHGGAEVAIASRLHPESRLVLPTRLQGYAYRRHLQSLVFSTLVRCLLPLTQRDTQAGLKGLSAAAAERVLPRLRCDGFGFDCELLVACLCLGLPVAEVPVTLCFENSASTTGLRAMSRMVRELWSIRRDWRRWRPEPGPAATGPERRRAA
jgi:dolichyl-phosphate beta-glucosyltransferase